jgi:hypothetical protein
MNSGGMVGSGSSSTASRKREPSVARKGRKTQTQVMGSASTAHGMFNASFSASSSQHSQADAGFDDQQHVDNYQVCFSRS